MSSLPLLQQLEQQLLALAARAGKLDQQMPEWQQRDYFSSVHFQTHSPHLLDYVQESMQLCQRLKQSLQQDSGFASQLLSERLAQQIDTLMRAFDSSEVRRKEQSPRRKSKAKTTAAPAGRQQAGALLRSLGGTAQAMYQQLAEYHGFERRLQDMVQQAAASQQPTDVQLALHARLGRCRKAISALEAEIQWFEQRGRREG